MADWQIQRLAPRHDRSAFDCGHPALDAWLKQRAGQFDRKDLARTFVAVLESDTAVLGYYAISAHRVLPELLPSDEGKRLPRLDVPVALLGRLAVDRRAQGKGLGEHLLIDALRRIEHLADQIGIRAVEVDAIDERASAFYSKYGFRPLNDDANHLFLPLHVIRSLGLPPP